MSENFLYSILLKENDILTTTKKERIMQRSKLFNSLQFVVEPIYHGHEMADCTVSLEYVLPVSRKYCMEILTLEEERYEDHLVYKLPIDTNLTAEAGKIEIQLTFARAELTEDGRPIQRVRKTGATTIEVLPIIAWSDVIPDSALTSLDQRLIKMDAQLKEMNDLNENLADSKADNLKFDPETNELQLMSGAKEIGKKVSLNEETEISPTYNDVVEF